MSTKSQFVLTRLDDFLGRFLITARKRSLRRLCFYRCLSVHTGGVCVCGCSWGVCVVAPAGRRAWLLPGGHAWLLPGGVCVVAPRGHAWVLPGGHAWVLLVGGMCGCSQGACMVAPRGAVCVVALGGGHAWDMMRYRDTINERAVRILLECILVWAMYFHIS